MTQALRFAVAATALVAAGASTAFGQSPPAQTPEPPATIFSNLSVFDVEPTKSTQPTFVVMPVRSGVETTCIGCRGFETTVLRPESTSLNAPWALRGRWRRQTTFGVVSTGFLGVRNYALPLPTVMPLGGDLDPVALSTAGMAVDSAISQWSMTAGVEKTLVTREHGASVGVTGDVLIPFMTEETVAVGDPRIRSLKSATVRFGLVLRW